MNKRQGYNNIVVIALVLLIIGLAAVGGYFWWSGTQQKHETPNTSPSMQTDQSSNSTPTSKTMPLMVYYIATDDNGTSGDKIGCGDSVVPVETPAVTTTDVIKSSFASLLTNHKKDYGQSGLYNALYQSNLTYVSSNVNDDTVTVVLTGTITQGGECDAPRIKAQLEYTAMHAAGTKKAVITVNDKSLDSVLSLK